MLRGFPWLLRLPLIKQLFSSNDTSVAQSDLVMLLTPRIVRTQELTPQDLAPIYIGTSTNLGLSGPTPAINPQGELPAIQDPAAPPVPGAAALPAAPLAAPPAPTGPQGAAPGSPVATTASGGQIVMSVPSPDFRVGGGPYTVPISITNASQLSNVSLTITFNPAVIRVRTVQEGTFMRAGGVNAAFTQQADSARGRVDIAIVRTGDVTGVAGSGMLAALLLEAIAPGPANLAVTATATAPGGGQVGLQYAPVPPVSVR